MDRHSAPGTIAPTQDERRLRHQAMRHRRRQRLVYSVVAIVAVLSIGTIGLRVLGGFDWVDAFYFESMLATGQGPPFLLTSDAAKLFASLMAFLSVGTVITALILTVGPALARLWREAIELAEHEIRKVDPKWAAHEEPAEGRSRD